MRLAAADSLQDWENLPARSFMLSAVAVGARCQGDGILNTNEKVSLFIRCRSEKSFNKALAAC